MQISDKSIEQWVKQIIYFSHISRSLKILGCGSGSGAQRSCQRLSLKMSSAHKVRRRRRLASARQEPFVSLELATPHCQGNCFSPGPGLCQYLNNILVLLARKNEGMGTS